MEQENRKLIAEIRKQLKDAIFTVINETPDCKVEPNKTIYLTFLLPKDDSPYLEPHLLKKVFLSRGEYGSLMIFAKDQYGDEDEYNVDELISIGDLEQILTAIG